MSIRALFIGGPQDGVRCILDCAPPYYYIETLPDYVASLRDASINDDAKVETVRHEYRRMDPGSTRADLPALYLHGSVTDLVSALVAGYR